MHAIGMAFSMSPASYTLGGDSYFADLYNPAALSIEAYSTNSDGFPWGMASSSAPSAYSNPAQSPPVSALSFHTRTPPNLFLLSAAGTPPSLPASAPAQSQSQSETPGASPPQPPPPLTARPSTSSPRAGRPQTPG